MQARLDAGEKPHFLPETRRVRESDWKVRLAACFKSADIVISFRDLPSAGVIVLTAAMSAYMSMPWLLKPLRPTADCLVMLGGIRACLCARQ